MAYTTAYSILRNREDSEDVVQEAFVKVFKSLHTFKGNSKFSTWLFRIVYHTSLTKYNKIRPERLNAGLESSENAISYSGSNDGTTALNSKDRTMFLEAALEQLNVEDKLVITLYYFEEKPLQEISELTGWALSATKVRIHRARLKLEKYLDQILSSEKKSLL